MLIASSQGEEKFLRPSVIREEQVLFLEAVGCCNRSPHYLSKAKLDFSITCPKPRISKYTGIHFQLFLMVIKHSTTVTLDKLNVTLA